MALLAEKGFCFLLVLEEKAEALVEVFLDQLDARCGVLSVRF